MFGGRDDAIGNDRSDRPAPVDIVGVLPATFDPGSETPQFWEPMVPNPEQRRARYSSVFGRLAPGISIAEAGPIRRYLDRAERPLPAREQGLSRPRLACEKRGVRDRFHLWLLLGRPLGAADRVGQCRHPPAAQMSGRGWSLRRERRSARRARAGFASC